jgi:predicted amidohydrolase YtcJ
LKGELVLSDNNILVKGTIWTGDADLPTADYFCVSNGVISKVGKLDDTPCGSAEQKVLDFTGNLIVPGFTDAHVHLTAYSKLNLYPNLTAASSIDELGEMISKAVSEAEKGAWVRCINYNEANWAKPVIPDMAFLDAIAPDNPIIVSRYCGHTHIANSLALKKSGLWNSGDPNIMRNASGIPTGIINEGGASVIIDAVAEEYETHERLKKIMLDACTKLSSLGITAVHACDAPSYALGEDLSVLQDIEKEGKLPIRVLCYHDELPNYTFKSGYGDDKISFAGLKLFMDGSLGGHTAALRQPYSDETSTKGQSNHTDDELEKMITFAHKRGIQVQIHAIGDRGIEQILDVLEKIIEKNGKPALPYRINHAIVCPPDLLDRIAKISAVVDVQPTQAFTDRFMAPLRLGPQRMLYSYCYKKMFDKGIVLTGSSDAPIEDPNPWIAIWTAVCLSDIDGTPLRGFDPGEKLTLEEALRIFTVNPWVAVGKGGEFGVIKKGSRADFAVIDGNPMNIEKDELRNVCTKATFVDGKCVWKN